jgi:peptidoglycan/xylan/chitin deacetylase (PgdA/CDA1 family)
MLWLEQNGYSAVTLRAVWNHWHGRGDLPLRPVVISFDDGTRSIARTAKPVLAAHHWPGVLNLDLSNLEPAWGLSATRVRALIREGWEVNSHTLSHPDLTRLDATHLVLEIGGSRTALRRRFGVPADFFCYPAGRLDARIIAAVKAAGYLGATTTINGLARRDAPYQLARVRVNGSDGQRGFAEKMGALSRRP